MSTEDDRDACLRKVQSDEFLWQPYCGLKQETNWPEGGVYFRENEEIHFGVKKLH